MAIEHIHDVLINEVIYGVMYLSSQCNIFIQSTERVSFAVSSYLRFNRVHEISIEQEKWPHCTIIYGE